LQGQSGRARFKNQKGLRQVVIKLALEQHIPEDYHSKEDSRHHPPFCCLCLAKANNRPSVDVQKFFFGVIVTGQGGPDRHFSPAIMQMAATSYSALPESPLTHGRK
jgi:hypothetical protein